MNKYKVIKNFEVRYLSNNDCKNQERKPLMEVEGGESLSFKNGDIIEIPNNFSKDKHIKLNRISIDNKILIHEIIESEEYYINSGFIESVD